MDNFEITKVNSSDITSLQKVGKRPFLKLFPKLIQKKICKNIWKKAFLLINF